jgi:hypothetical protein
MKLLAVVLLLSIATFAQFPVVPGLHMIEPDPNTGKPLLVKGGTAEDDWQMPIEVYSDADETMFVPADAARGVMWAGSWQQRGEYTVLLYSYFKTDAACNKWVLDAISDKPDGDKPDAAKRERLSHECHLIRYRREALSVDTQQKTLLRTWWILFDDHGDTLAGLQSKWKYQLSEMSNTPIGAATVRITQLVEQEQEYWNRKYGSQPNGSKDQTNNQPTGQQPRP